MALIKCKECGSEVSSKAEACPKCGAKIASKPMGCGSIIGVAILGIVIISTFSSIFSSNSSSPSLAATTSPHEAKTIVSEPKEVGSQWTYRSENDSMTKGKINDAIVRSSNTVNFEFPYSGEQHATLSWRTHPRYGKDVIFRIEKGQILCKSYQDCTILVRFDDGAPEKFSAVGPADNSSESAFFRNYGRLFDKMKKAKKIRVSANIYKQGEPIFEFDVSGFEQTKYAQK